MTTQAVPCVQTPCQSRYQANPAIMMMAVRSYEPFTPSCESCARWACHHWPGQPRMARLEDYADQLGMYADPFAHSLWESFIVPFQDKQPAAQEQQALPAAAAPPAPPAPAAAPEPEVRSPGHSLHWGIAAAISFVLGLVFCGAGLPDGTVSGSTPNIALIAFVILFILAAIPAGLIALLQYVPARQGPGQPASAKQGFTAADAAWIAAGAAGVWDMHHRHQKARERVAAEREAYAQRGRDRTQEEIRDLLREQAAQDSAPGTVWGAGPHRMTQRSDIHGNLT